MTITEFLEARIAEDEDAAGEPIFRGEPADFSVRDVLVGHSGGLEINASRLRAECAAKRAILEVHPLRLYLAIEGWDMWECQTCEGYPCDTLKALASAYKDHPDYRQEWAL